MFGAGNEQLSDLKRYQDVCAIEIKLSAAEMRGKKFDRINRMEAMHPRHAQKGSNPFLATYGIQLAFTRKLKSYMPPNNIFAKLSLINRVPLLESIVGTAAAAQANAERGELRRLDRNIALLESLGPDATAAQCLAVALAIKPRRR